MNNYIAINQGIQLKLEDVFKKQRLFICRFEEMLYLCHPLPEIQQLSTMVACLGALLKCWDKKLFLKTFGFYLVVSKIVPIFASAFRKEGLTVAEATLVYCKD